MYVERQDLPSLPRDQTIWRYLSFAKFIAFLHSKALYFATAVQMEDEYEGTFPRRVISGLRELLDGPHSEINLKRISNLAQSIRTRACLNCWYLSDYESEAMWRHSSNSEDGVALKSTIGRLQDSFAAVPETIYIGGVEYIDYDQDFLPAHDESEWFFYKRKEFAHEREVRALLIRKEHGLPASANSRGVLVPIPIETLLCGICVAPRSPFWIRELVGELLSHHGLGVPVHTSALTKPSYAF